MWLVFKDALCVPACTYTDRRPLRGSYDDMLYHNSYLIADAKEVTFVYKEVKDGIKRNLTLPLSRF